MENLTDDEEFLDVVEMALEGNRARIYHERPDAFEKWDDNEFLERYRLSKQTVRHIVDMISCEIEAPTQRNNVITPKEKVLITLRFFATGSFLKVVGDLHGIHISTTSRIVTKVSRAIARLAKKMIKMPTTNDELAAVKSGFYNIARFPRCIGSLDCTHIRIQSPGGENAEIYRNRKGYFSFNVQVVCDSNLNIKDIVCRWPGASHDAHIFRSSSLKTKFENRLFGNAVLVGDSGYEVKPYLITPLSNPMTRAEQLFNEAQIRTRNPIERCFGIWKRRFPILSYGIRLDSEKVEAVVIACAVLHNIALDKQDAIPEEDSFLEEELVEVQIQDSLQDNVRQTENSIVRKSFLNYFGSL